MTATESADLQLRHTPGPWHTDAVMGEDRHEICAEPTTESGNPNVIATVFCDLLDPHPAIGLTEANANARLIAAAPELLAALQDMLATHTARNVCGLERLTQVHQAARAAIAKATQP